MQTFRNHFKVPVISSISCTRPFEEIKQKMSNVLQGLHFLLTAEPLKLYKAVFWLEMFLDPMWRSRQAKSFVGSVVSGGNCGFGVWRQSIWRIYCPSILDESAENGLAANGSRSTSLFTGSLNRLRYIWLGLLVAVVTQRFVESFFLSISGCCSLGWRPKTFTTVNCESFEHIVDAYYRKKEWVEQIRSVLQEAATQMTHLL